MMIEPSQPMTVAAALEAEAQRLVARMANEPDQTPVQAPLMRELALVLEHLANARHLTARLAQSLLTDECAIRTELARLKVLVPAYSPAETKIRVRLLAIEAERRRLAIQHEERLRTLNGHLFAIFRKAQLLQ